MGMLRVAHLVWKRWKRPFDTLQVEPTTHCFLRCSFCPHESLRSQWTSRHMSMAVFDRLSLSFPLARGVWLQGWGEPLLHPEIFGMVKRGKDAGCRVGLTTNGMLLQPKDSSCLIEAGLDSLAVSLAGATLSTHAALRVGSDLPEILNNLANLTRLKQRLNVHHPRVIVSFLMLRSNLGELPAVIDLAREAGVQEVEATNLCYLPDEVQDSSKAFSSPGLRMPGSTMIDEARDRAASFQIAFHAHSLIDSKEVAVCDARPIHNVFIAADGGVFPCGHLALPVDPIPRFFRGQLYELPRRPLGSLSETGLSAVWGREEYKSFRKIFRSRKNCEAEEPADLWLYQPPASEGNASRRPVPPKPAALPTLPPMCGSCYAVRGL